MNRDQMADGTLADGQGAGTVAEIIVPDSYTGFVRLLLFLYTGENLLYSRVRCIPYIPSDRI